MKWRTHGNSDHFCYECRSDMVESCGGIDAVQARADAHEKQFPGFRRETVTCSRHNYGATILFERDCEF